MPEPAFDESIPPYQMFEKFFTIEEIERICEESNKYAQSKGNHVFKMTPERLRSFIAILLLSGYIPMPRQDMYWQMRDDSYNRLISNIMTKNEYEVTKQYLHLADNDRLDKADKFAKVRPLFDSINKQCKENYKPTQHVSVDESMVPYFGRHSAKQYIHGKPIKFGYKLWVMSNPLGYCIQFRTYSGKDTQLSEYGDTGLGLGAAVVAKLVQSLFSQEESGSNYHVVMNNFFTSPGLLRHLREKSIAATGTVRTCRMENPPLKSIEEVNKLERGASDVSVQTKSNIAAIRWKDNKVVNVLSTFVGKNSQKMEKRYSQKEKKSITVPQPNVINVYNRYMGGVDRMDQNISCYMVHLRSKKWWWPLFRFCIDLAANNAFQLYKLHKLDAGETRMDVLCFRRAIVESYYHLHRKSIPPPLFPGPRVTPRKHVKESSGNHWTIKGSQRRCAKKGCSGTSVYCCEICNVGLHPQCFKAYHFE